MLRAVIYGRCSTEEESQKDALVNQVTEAKECVLKHGWLLMDCYVESRSGTTTKGRKEYNRLYEDMLQDKFDVIVIKSQDRLMRNTKDWYLFVDRLTAQHKKLYMYLEQKFYSADDALITGIKAILAEDYSRELSKKINNAHKGRQRHNGNIILTSNAYGFKRLPDKSVVLVEEEAKVKERMYQLCAEGFGTRTIATILKKEGILSRSGKPFAASSILRIIRNPINKGTVVMNKKHFDFDTKKVICVPEEEQFVYENKVPCTVSDELWEKANLQIDSRRIPKKKKEDPARGKNPGKQPFCGKIICGLCGEPYYRRMRRVYKNKTIVYDWKCKRYLMIGRNAEQLARPQLRKVQLEEDKGCDNVHLEEEMLNHFLENVWKEKYDINKEKIMEKILSLLEKVLREANTDIQSEIDAQCILRSKIELQMNRLVDKLLDGVLEDTFYQAKQRKLENELQNIQEKIRELESKQQKENELQERIANIERMIMERNIMKRSIVDAILVEIDKIVIFPTYLEIEYASKDQLGTADDSRADSNDNEQTVRHEKVRVDYGILFDYRRQQREALQEVVDYMKAKPNITAREIAEKCGMSISCIQQRIAKLRREERIRFVGKGGRGYWEVLENQKREEKL